MDAGDLDLEDLPPKALRKLIKSLLMKNGKPRTEKESEEADDEREALSDLHEETSGKSAGVPVETDEELPPELADESDPNETEPDNDMDDEEEDGKKPPFPPKKKGKK
jgi:hypothetical protein